MTEHGKRFDDTGWGKTVKLWPLLVALVSVIVMATTIKNKVDDHEIRISKMETALINIGANTDRLVDELLDKK